MAIPTVRPAIAIIPNSAATASPSGCDNAAFGSPMYVYGYATPGGGCGGDLPYGYGPWERPWPPYGAMFCVYWQACGNGYYPPPIPVVPYGASLGTPPTPTATLP